MVAALEEAIKEAEDAVDAATKSAESDVLKTAVELVTGAEPEADGYPMDAAAHGKMVAEDIGGALMPTSTTDGSGERVPDLADMAPDADGFPDAVNMNNHVGSTWAEIVGAANIMDMRIATGLTDTASVPAASIADQPRSSITADTDLTGMDLEDGAQHPGNYKGIMGTVFCAGEDCIVSMGADGETLTGPWYFTPTRPMEWYLRNAADDTTDDTTYEAETLYARFGHWLDVNSADGGLTDINTYAMTGGNVDSINLTVDTGADATTLTDTEATYNGDGRGYVAPQGVRCSRWSSARQPAIRCVRRQG